jgi:selenide,water dikinase
MDASIVSMLTLNNAACKAMLAVEAHSCTDITGFGFLGHAREMAAAGKVTLVIESGAVPLLPGAFDYAAAGAIPGGLRNNMEFVSGAVAKTAAIDPTLEFLLYDPQTSGGLLIAMPEADVAKMQALYPPARRVGRVVERRGTLLEIE